MSKSILVLILLATALVPACEYVENRVAPLQDIVVPTHRPVRAYEELFPHYAEICAATQYRPREGGMGGVGGHAVMYLKGICRKEDAPYPTLTPCRAQTTDPYDVRHGVGISVNQTFKNVNWVAIPGKRFFLDGDLGDGQRLTREHYNKVLQEVVRAGIFRGVDLHHQYLPEKAAATNLEKLVAEQSIGTDFALRFARTIFCGRLPMTEPQMQRVMDYLNALNEKYAAGEADYNWSGYHDNCTHTLVNALAAAEVWRPKSVGAVKLRQLFNLAIPSNEVIHLVSLANLEPLEDFRRIYRDRIQRKSLEEFNWLPMQHGALFKSLPIHQDNDLFDTKIRILTLGRPFRPSAARKAREFLVNARFTDLEANLRYYRSRYERILESRGTAKRPFFADDDYRAGEERYYSYIEAQLTEVRNMLRQLPQLRSDSTNR